ncbi:MAG: beta-propeller domain-containing protein [Ruminococcus sp.]|nr:beta-propeller domain-containing protein [Ruminococcus sp.]
MSKNDDKIKKALENEEVPKELEPQNIKKMLDEKAPSKKRGNISVAGRVGALVASLAVIAGGTLAYTNINTKEVNCPADMSIIPKTTSKSVIDEDIQDEDIQDEDIQQLANTGSYMTGAENYEQIYTLFKEVADNRKSKGDTLRTFGIYADNMDIAETADGAVPADTFSDFAYDDVEYEEAFDEAPAEVNGEIFQGAIAESEKSELITEPVTAPPEMEADGGAVPTDSETGAGTDFSETYNQEENVLEADIVKTDGKNIYYVYNNYKDDTGSVNYATVDNGMFTNSGKINLDNTVSGFLGEDYETDVYVQDMYLYNDMLIVLGTVNGYNTADDDYNWKNSCFVTFYTNEETPQLIDTYYQEGDYNDVRISPEGYMYLITGYSSWNFYRIDTPEDIERYIPACGLSENIECIPAGDILLPEEKFEDMYNLSYTVIGSIDLTQSGTFSAVDTKALAGYTGKIYCSGNNMYTTYGWEDTDITRISINGGVITPEASGTVEGRINDQFSMSEYNGYFRIAVTNDEYEEVYHSYYNEDNQSSWEKIKDKLMSAGIEEDGYYSQQLVKRDNRLYVLDMDLNVVGSVSDFGVDETIKSVKFSGDIAYVVTYEQTDPLFAIDLSDPTNPTILDEFKILGYSTYMQEWDDGLLLGFGVNADEDGIETGIKLTMFDNSDPYNLNAVATYTLDRSDDEWLYSEAVWERKALLIAPEKNLIGIPVTLEKYAYDVSKTEWDNTAKYMFFSFDDSEFTFKGEISSTENNAWIEGFSRAVYIGDYVYALSGDKFISADIATITECDRVDF